MLPRKQNINLIFPWRVRLFGCIHIHLHTHTRTLTYPHHTSSSATIQLYYSTSVANNTVQSNTSLISYSPTNTTYRLILPSPKSPLYQKFFFPRLFTIFSGRDLLHPRKVLGQGSRGTSIIISIVPCTTLLGKIPPLLPFLGKWAGHGRFVGTVWVSWAVHIIMFN